MGNSLLEVIDLKTQFFTENGKLTAVDGVSFNVDEGEILGVVGESGCGKSATSQSILKLHDESLVKYEGQIKFNEKNLLSLSQSQMQKIRGNDISMIFQDPMSALNPVFTIGNQLIETIHLHQNVSNIEAYEKSVEILKTTGIPDPAKRLNEYPHQLSGGMKQRVLIAIALVCRPNLLIADEPTTALDVTIQAQILDLIMEMNNELKMAIIFITHDLGVVSELCTRVAVMYLGQIVEEANVRDLFSKPLHPYTKGLLKSTPQLEDDRTKRLYTIEGRVPSLKNVPKGCRFSTRCPYVTNICREKAPELQQHQGKHQVRCWHYKDILESEEEVNYVK